MYFRDELVLRQWLDDVLTDAKNTGAVYVCVDRGLGKDNDRQTRQMRSGTDDLENLDTIELGHFRVKQEQGRVARRTVDEVIAHQKIVQRLLAIPGDYNLIWQRALFQRKQRELQSLGLSSAIRIGRAILFLFSPWCAWLQ